MVSPVADLMTSTGLRPAAPQSVVRAVWLMYAGAFLTALNAVVIILVAPRVGVLHIGTLRPVVESHTRQVVTAAFTGTFDCLVWLWMARKNKSGRAWARVLSTVLFGLCCFGTLLDLNAGAIESRVLRFAIWLVALAATFQLWRPESGRFYRRQVPPTG